ncbi:eCIS core domain-containing protein [Occallatibacter riparius]|uniref:DUF4157 domain-containing protein n=1 Tax=Occallatibacter riparius TaxID=1002689 RepID=A0A9J7BJK0_9BACT|nr:DUF4157 domain-containing protein [Occallatibacter riparius]UWZ82855.1 DUF4157 domain-containing protein [Occallatibacter riparius]
MYARKNNSIASSQPDTHSPRRPASTVQSAVIGNQAMLRRLSRSSPHLHRKLAIGAVHDPLEAQADHVADRVMRMPEPAGANRNNILQRKCAECEEEEKLHRKTEAAPQSDSEAPPIVHDVLNAPGEPLDAQSRAFMEPRLGTSLDPVRIHTTNRASDSARVVGARAYTVGNDIVFGHGEYSPSTREGRHLLAHELAHVAQQSAFDGYGPNTLRRSPVTEGSVGEFYLQQETPEQLQADAAEIVAALRAPNLDAYTKMLLENNLQAVEKHASARSVDLPVAAGYRLGQIIFALATDMKGLTEELRVIGSMKVGYQTVGSDMGFSSFYPELNWDVDELQWVAQTLMEGADLAGAGEAGGPQSADQLRAAGAHVTAALFAFRGVAVHMAYLHTGVAFATEGTQHTIARKVGWVREDIQKMLAPMRTLDPATVEKAVKQIDSPSFGFGTDFDSFVEELEDNARTWHRVGQIANIVGLALTAGELALSGGAGPSGAGEGGGGGGFGGAVATVRGATLTSGAVGSLEWIEAMRRLVAIGAISSATLGRLGGGVEPQPSKPMESSAPKPKTELPKAKVDPAVDKAVEEGIEEYEGPQTKPPKAPLRRPASKAASEAARTKFEKIRDGFAQKLGLPKGGQVHHAIELQVLDRFPGAFSESELNSLDNMRGVPPELEGKMQLHQSKIREVWNRHYRTIEAEIAQKGLKEGTAAYRDLVRRALIEDSREIDHLLGQFFSEEGAGRAVKGLQN